MFSVFFVGRDLRLLYYDISLIIEYTEYYLRLIKTMPALQCILHGKVHYIKCVVTYLIFVFLFCYTFIIFLCAFLQHITDS